MMPLKPSLSDATTWSITQELSIVIQEASFMLIYDDYKYMNHYRQSSIYDHKMCIVQATGAYINNVGPAI